MMMSSAALWFLATILFTLGITAWAARRSTGRADLYAAGGRITAGQNGLAIAGDFMSATTLLGTTGLLYANGSDALIYFLCPLVGFCLMLLFVAGPLRRLGRFTLGDVLEAQLADRRIRIFAGVSTVAICLIYLVAQMVGAGALISVLFGLSFDVAVILVGGLVAIYVAFGGMLAATWVQIIKAVLLTLTVLILAVLVMAASAGVEAFYDRAAQLHPLGDGLYRGGGLKLDAFSAWSLSAGLTLGMLGLPHLLIRLFTVSTEAAAKRSVVVATTIIGAVFALLFAVIGPGAVVHVAGRAEFMGPDGKILGGGNMAVMHLARALGGDVLFGVMAAIAFATILAVVAGLTIAGASATSHDLLATLRRRAFSEKAELRVFRIATVVIAAGSVAVAVLLKAENTAFLAGLAFAVAASANFPVLMLAIYWRGVTAAGALAGGITGLAGSVLMIVLGPAVWVKTLGHPAPIAPTDYPTLITAPLAFAVAIGVSHLTRRR